MKVALIRNHDAFSNTRQMELVRKRAGVFPQLGLGYIHTALAKTGHQVKTIDAQVLGLDAEQLKSELTKFKPQLVGVTATTPGFPGAVQACQIAKEIGATVVLGGPHTEVFVKENLHHSCIDYVGVGEGVTIVPQLATALENHQDPARIIGLVSRTFANDAAPMLNLQDMGWPDRESTPFDNCYSVMAKRPFATMISSRGCPFKCSFCFKQTVDKKPLFRDPEDVVNEMEYLVQRFKIREIMFYDDLFTMKRTRIHEICELIARRNLRVRWDAPTRADFVDEKLMRAMARAGCVRLRFGIESGDEQLLQQMHKESDLGIIEEAVRAAKRAGLQTFGYFIVGWIGETPQQFARTLDFAKNIPLDYASFYTATPLAGTQLHQSAVKAGLIDADYWRRFVRSETSQRVDFLVPDAHLRTKQAYQQFYLRWPHVKKLFAQANTPRLAWSTICGIAGLIKPKPADT